MSSASLEPQESSRPRVKRMRHRHACNLCRARKVRCDPGNNSCSNCELAGVECVTTDPMRGSSRALDRRRRQLAGVQQPGGSFMGSSPMSPVSSGSPTELSYRTRDPSVESSLARRLAEMEQRLQILDRERAESRNPFVKVHQGRPQNVSNVTRSVASIENPNPRKQFHLPDIRRQSPPNQSQERYGKIPCPTSFARFS
jgi:hypothetical protein